VVKGKGLEGRRGRWTEEHTISKMKNNGCKNMNFIKNNGYSGNRRYEFYKSIIKKG